MAASLSARNARKFRTIQGFPSASNLVTLMFHPAGISNSHTVLVKKRFNQDLFPLIFSFSRAVAERIRPRILLHRVPARPLCRSGWDRVTDLGVSPDWLKFKNPDAPAVKREVEEDWR